MTNDAQSQACHLLVTEQTDTDGRDTHRYNEATHTRIYAYKYFGINRWMYILQSYIKCTYRHTEN